MNQIRGSCRNKEKGNKKKGGNDAKGIGIYEEDGTGEKAVPAGTNLRSGVQKDHPETGGCKKITRKLADAYMIIGDSSFFGKTGDSEKTMAMV